MELLKPPIYSLIMLCILEKAFTNADTQSESIIVPISADIIKVIQSDDIKI